MHKSIEELAAEITELKKSPNVILAQRENRVREILENELDLLRKQEARGREIMTNRNLMKILTHAVEGENIDLW